MLTNVDIRLFIFVWMLWFASEILLNRKFRSSKDDQKGQDKGSIRVLWIGLLGGNAMAVLASIFFTSSVFRISSNHQIAYAGLVVTVIGMLFRFYAVWSLGRNFTVDVTIREGHNLHTDGVYSLLRHPSYTGMIISFIGFGISMNSWPGLLAVCVFVGASTIYRINVEEKALLEAFGKEYSDYKKRTSKLIPWLY